MARPHDVLADVREVAESLVRSSESTLGRKLTPTERDSVLDEALSGLDSPVTNASSHDRCPECGARLGEDGECPDCGYTENSEGGSGCGSELDDDGKCMGTRSTANAAPNQPRHQETGQYLHGGINAGPKQAHAAAVKGYGSDSLSDDGRDVEHLEREEDDGDGDIDSLGGVRVDDHQGLETAPDEEAAEQATYNAYLAYNRDWPQEKRDKLDDKDFAGPGRSFPITRQQDVDAAVSSIGRSKHDPAVIKAGIQRVARQKGLTLPDSWQESDRVSSTHNANPEGCNQYKGCGSGGGSSEHGSFLSRVSKQAREASAQVKGESTKGAGAFAAKHAKLADKAAESGDSTAAYEHHMTAHEWHNRATSSAASREDRTASNAHDRAANLHLLAAKLHQGDVSHSSGAAAEKTRWANDTSHSPAADKAARTAVALSHDASLDNSKEGYKGAAAAHEEAAAEHAKMQGGRVGSYEHGIARFQHLKAAAGLYRQADSPTHNANPGGCNQYKPCAGGGGTKAASTKADKASTRADKRDTPADHEKAHELHNAAMVAHVTQAARLMKAGNDKAAQEHFNQAQAHRDKANHHGNKAGIAVTTNDDSATQNREDNMVQVTNRKEAISVLTANCSCERDKQALNTMSDDMLLLMARNSATVAGDPKKQVQAGGEEDDDDSDIDDSVDYEDPDELVDQPLKEKVIAGKGKGTMNSGKAGAGKVGRTFTDILRNHGSRQDMETWNYSQAIVQREKEQLAQRITANMADPAAREAYTKELTARDIPELKKMLTLIPQPTYNAYDTPHASNPAADLAAVYGQQAAPLFLGGAGGAVTNASDLTANGMEEGLLVPPAGFFGYGKAE